MQPKPTKCQGFRKLSRITCEKHFILFSNFIFSLHRNSHLVPVSSHQRGFVLTLQICICLPSRDQNFQKKKTFKTSFIWIFPAVIILRNICNLRLAKNKKQVNPEEPDGARNFRDCDERISRFPLSNSTKQNFKSLICF